MPEPFSMGFGVTFSEAVAAAKRRKVTLPAAFYDEIPARVRQYAFTATGLTALDQVQAVLDSLNAKIEKGDSFQEWQRGALEQNWSIPRTRLELISRNHAQTSYMAGHWDQFEQNAATRPFLMYSAINDSRTRPAHRLMNGHIAPVADPLWLRWSPPCGHNCRCSLISLTPQQAHDRGLGNQVVPNVQPDEGWGHPPADAGDRMRDMVDQRAKEIGPAFPSVMDTIFARGYTFPPLSPVQATVANEWRGSLRKQYGTTYDALSDAQVWALRQYASDSFPINAYLRNLMERTDEDMLRDIVSIQDALRTLGDGKPRTVYRGQRADPRFDRLADKVFHAGTVIRAQSFISASSSELIASEFGDRYFMVIHGKSAAGVDGFYTVESENEFIFPANTNFRVVSVTKAAGIWRIELEETTDAAQYLFSVTA